MSGWIAFVQVEGFCIKAHQPVPRGLEPMVVIQDNQGVLEADSQARSEDVQRSMSPTQVRCLSPRARIVTFDREQCLLLYRQVWDTVADHSPVVEPIDIHQGLADIGKVVSRRPQAKNWQGEISRQI